LTRFVKNPFVDVEGILFVSEDLKAELKDGAGEEGKSSSALPLPKEDAADMVSAEKYFLPFELACQSRSPGIVVTALDCLQVRDHLSRSHQIFISILPLAIFKFQLIGRNQLMRDRSTSDLAPKIFFTFVRINTRHVVSYSKKKILSVSIFSHLLWV